MGGLLIVDDQDVVRQGIRKMVEEFKMGFDMIYEASNGTNAFQIACDREPDIILVDIMMPGMDGLELVNELKRVGSPSHIVIISAINKFDFARKAIALKVDNYILKPVTRKELYQVLTSVLGNIRLDNEKLEKFDEQQRRYDFLLLYEYLNSSDIFTNAKILYKNMGISRLLYPYFQIVLVRLKQAGGNDRKIGKNGSEMEGLKEELDRMMSNRNLSFISFDPTDQLIVYIINMDTKGGEVIAEIESNCYCFSYRAFFGASRVIEGEEALPKLFRQAVVSLQECQFRSLRFCRHEEIRMDGTLLIGIGNYNKIVEAVRNGMKKELTLIIEDVFFNLNKSDNSFENAKDSLVNLIYFIQLSLKEYYVDLKISDDFKKVIASSIDFFGLKAEVKMEIERMYDYVGGIREANVASPLIRAVILYISRNYSEELSLTLIANEHNINYNYLSTLFTKVVGMPYTNYLMKYRLEKAKELLATGSYKVHEVAERVGFNDSKYFNKVFRRLYNKTPARDIPKHS